MVRWYRLDSTELPPRKRGSVAKSTGRDGKTNNQLGKHARQAVG